MHSFLFELGIEELPDHVILPAIDQIRASFGAVLEAERLSSREIQIGSTPRRLSIWCSGLPEKQDDQKITKNGPSVKIAYTESGELSPAGNGFLRKSGAGKDDIFIQDTPKGEVLAVSFVQPGRRTVDILREWILQVIGQIPLPKKMIWRDPALAFSRPIRWIVALWDTELIELDFFGIKAGNQSRGNRYLGLDKLWEIDHAERYESILKTAGVIVNRDERKAMIQAQCAALFEGSDYHIKEDQRLLETVCNLVEQPQAVIGEFDPSFLEIPEKVISSTISQNQKYFSVYDKNDQPVNQFVFVSNGDPKAMDKIRAGNEKVVAARLEDAAWFFEEDCKLPLETYLERLQSVVFQSKLGTMAAKTARIVKLAGYLADELKLPDSQKAKALRTAELCKADLVTLMLGEKEFTKLQGYMGREYALASGEDPEVAEGIYEHYMPRGSKDSLPQTACGAICAVCDKLDTVAGIIGVGIVPTGSADPFALRRAASGLVQIIADRGWEIDLMDLISRSIELLEEELTLEAEAPEQIRNFFSQRARWLLKELGIGYDVAAAVMLGGISNLPDLIGRARALQDLKSEDDFIRLVLGFKRVANIIAEEKSFAKLDSGLFEEEAERDLHEAIKRLSQLINEALSQRDYRGALKDLIGIADAIDEFFDRVLVNCEDDALRQNRYALLNLIRREFFRVADLSLIVVESE